MRGVHSLISPFMRWETPVRHKYHNVLRIIILIYSLTVRMIWTTCGFSSAFGLMKGSEERRKKNHAICLLRLERLLAYPRPNHWAKHKFRIAYRTKCEKPSDCLYLKIVRCCCVAVNALQNHRMTPFQCCTYGTVQNAWWIQRSQMDTCWFFSSSSSFSLSVFGVFFIVDRVI